MDTIDFWMISIVNIHQLQKWDHHLFGIQHPSHHRNSHCHEIEINPHRLNFRLNKASLTNRYVLTVPLVLCFQKRIIQPISGGFIQQPQRLHKQALPFMHQSLSSLYRNLPPKLEPPVFHRILVAAIQSLRNFLPRFRKGFVISEQNVIFLQSPCNAEDYLNKEPRKGRNFFLWGIKWLIQWLRICLAFRTIREQLFS